MGLGTVQMLGQVSSVQPSPAHYPTICPLHIYHHHSYYQCERNYFIGMREKGHCFQGQRERERDIVFKGQREKEMETDM